MQQRSVLFALLLAGCAAGQPRPNAPVEAPRVSESALSGAGRRFGLIVNGDSERRHLDNVRSARRALLENGVAARDLVVLTRERATRERLTVAVARLRHELGPRDQLVVYFTGHGSPGAIVLGEGRALSHDDLLAILAPLERVRSVFVFDACYSGALPERLVERGFRVEAMAPAAEGRETYCQFFAPHFWGALERHLDFDGDGKPSFREAFLYAIEIYDTELERRGLPRVEGSHAEAIRELASPSELRGPAIVMLSARWCRACRRELPRVELAERLLGAGVRAYTLDVDENPLRRELSSIAPAGVHLDVLPTLLFVQDTKVRSAVEGARGIDELISLARSAFPSAARTKDAIVAELRRSLSSRDPERARFALVGLTELGSVDDALVRACERLLAELSTADAAALVARLQESAAFSSLLERLSPAARMRVKTARADDVRDRARHAAKLVSASDPERRAAGWFALWQLAKSGLPAETLLPALPAVAELLHQGDADTRRVAESVADELVTAIEAHGPPQLRFTFAGNASIASSELERALRGQSLAVLVHWGGVVVARSYAARGFRDVHVGDARFRYEPGSGLTLSFAIDEGEAYTASSFALAEEGGAPLTLPFRAPRLAGPLDFVRLTEIASDVLGRYRDAGHYAADADVSDGCSADRRCAVSIRVKPGPVFRFGQIRFGPLGSTTRALDSARFARVAGLTSGARYAESALLRAKKRVLALPEVSDVAVSTARAEGLTVDVHFEIALKP